MSTYRHETENERLDIKSSGDPRNTFIWVHEGKKEAAIIIPNADIPAVAAELLKAAGQECVLVPKSVGVVLRSTCGELKSGSGNNAAYGNAGDSPAWHRARAAHSIAIAEHLEAWSAREAAEKANAAMEAAAKLEAAEKKLQERRNEVATKVKGYSATYEGSFRPLQVAIDRIIELEDGK